MSKIYNLYENEVDKTWYDSSNVIYSECDDVQDGLKVLRVTFKNGRTYKYSDVNVNDYLLFRESLSQGKALNKYIKQYANERVSDLDVEGLMEELKKLTEIVDYSTSGGTCNYLVEIDKNVDICRVFCEGNLVDNFAMKDKPSELLSRLCNSLKVEYNIIEKE